MILFGILGPVARGACFLPDFVPLDLAKESTYAAHKGIVVSRAFKGTGNEPHSSEARNGGVEGGFVYQPEDLPW